MTSTALAVHTPTTSALTPLDKAGLKAQLARLEDPEMLQLQQRLAAAYDAACAALIGPGDVQIDGKNKDGTPRVFKKKSAWRKLGRHFTVSTEVLREDVRLLGEGEFVAVTVVRGIASWGQSCEAVGACGSDEEEGRRRITMADALGTAQTRATNRAISDLIAMGEVSAEEIGGRPAREKGEQGAQATEPELTLEEALALEFPWKKHAKYGGQLLKEVSTKTLLIVGEWAKAKIDAGDTSRSIPKLHRACVLICESRPDLEQAVEERRVEKEKDDARTAAASTVDGEGAPAAAATSTSSAGMTASEAPAVQNGPPPAAEEQRVDPTSASSTPGTSSPTSTVQEGAPATTSEAKAAEDPRAKSIRLTTRLHELLFADNVVKEVQTRVRERLKGAGEHTDDVIEAAIAELVANQAPF